MNTQIRGGQAAPATRPGEFSTIREPALSVVDGRLTLEFLGLLEHPPCDLEDLLVPPLRLFDPTGLMISGLARIEACDEPAGQRCSGMLRSISFCWYWTR